MLILLSMFSTEVCEVDCEKNANMPQAELPLKTVHSQRPVSAANWLKVWPSAGLRNKIATLEDMSVLTCMSIM